MDFTVIKHTDKIEPYRLGNCVKIVVTLGTFCYLVYLALHLWSITAFLYMGLAIYWISNMDAGMSRVHYELTKHKDGRRYQNLLKLSFSNPMIRFYYKLLFLVVFILLLKVFGSFVGSMNYFSLSSNKEARTQLMIDIEVSVEENTFTFKTLLMNLYPETILIALVILILFLEHSIVPFTKESIQNILKRWGSKASNFCKIMQCTCIFLMPIVAKSPLTILPLLGLVLGLLLIFYKAHSYKAVVWIPETFVSLSVLGYMLVKVNSVGVNLANKLNFKPYVSPLASWGESREAVVSVHPGHHEPHLRRPGHLLAALLPDVPVHQPHPPDQA